MNTRISEVREGACLPIGATCHSETRFRWKYVSEIASSVCYARECIRCGVMFNRVSSDIATGAAMRIEIDASALLKSDPASVATRLAKPRD